MAHPEITHVFVLMLENHSFDNIFAMSGLTGIDAATTSDYNTYNNKQYFVKKGAPECMPTDPGHEFDDVLEQLTGRKCLIACPTGTADPRTMCYPSIDLSGFATNYATSESEKTGLPAPEAIGDIMACFDTPVQLPVIRELAAQFAICDHWFSSLPGPTWPNRFFVHGATSMGVTSSPSLGDELKWETYDGFGYDCGSIFDHLSYHGKTWRLYNDRRNRFSDDPSTRWQFGWVPQVSALKGIHLRDVHSLETFEADLNAADGYPYFYTFIEPNFGESVRNTYQGGSSQHPKDDPTGGEGLIRDVYETIVNSPLWKSSLLIVTYDEHGGFYDSVKPGAAVRPDHHVSSNGFDFSRYGVRVPAVIVSPYIPAGTVSKTVYDHTSILKTVETIAGLDPLTKRDCKANHVLDLLSLAEPRQDRPVLPVVPLQRPLQQRDPSSTPQPESALLPSEGNLIGFLQIVLKADLTLANGDPDARRAAFERFQQIKTLGDAQAYFESVIAKVGWTLPQARKSAE